MIISPPFLSQTELPVYDEQCIEQVMPGGFVGSGAFPVSVAMGWHGGIHIHAPAADEPVRAIADGVVVYRRDGATIQYAEKDTSTGCVVIRHTTEIGATDDGKSVEFVYYSITMHLSKLDDKLQAVGKPIYRKDKLGLAGKVHGASPRIHFEVVAGDKDMEALTGRTTGRVSLQSDGRSSVVYGTSYVFVPSGAAYFSGAAAPSSKSGAVLVAASGNTSEDLVVGIRYSEGDGFLDSYQLNGTPIGTEPEPDQSEYRLYSRCVALHKESGVASPSDWLEMLRFGRKLGTEAFPTTAPHWRKIKLPGGAAGWIDLNATNTKKYSDGDYPHFMGWRLVDDDSTDDNSRCESKAIERLLNTTPDGDPVADDTPQSRMKRLCATDVQAKLAKTICKFPSEWVADDVSTRWKWITEVGNPYNPTPADTKGFEDVQAYAKALCFWADLPKEDKDRLTTKHWHFHPREFIIQMRRCGWLSKAELVQCIPQNALRSGQWADEKGGKHKGVFWEKVAVAQSNLDSGLIANHRIPLNRMMRKYCISTSLRIASFLGNAVQESGWFSTLRESGGDSYWYAPWYGRGFLQLTHPGNYFDYWEWRGRTIPAALRKSIDDVAKVQAQKKPAERSKTALADTNFPGMTQEVQSWRADVDGATKTPRENTGDALVAPSDSAGFYWISIMVRYADAAHVLERVTVATVDAKGKSTGEKVYYRSPTFWKVSASVNLPGAINNTNYSGINGFDSRCAAYGAALATLAEIRFATGTTGVAVEYPEGETPRRMK